MLDKLTKKHRQSLFLSVILAISLFLRVLGLDKVPVSLYADEVDVGYQAYSILKTGKDYFGNTLPVTFQFYTENRSNLYIYSMIPTVAIFGITPWGVRLPAAVFGVLGVWSLFLLVRQLTKDDRLALISAGVLAISPWHIQYSRVAFDVTMLLAFLLFGLFFFFKALQAGSRLWISVALLVSCAWIYSTAKLFIPFLLVFLFYLWRGQIVRMKKGTLVKAALAGLIIGTPIILSTFFGSGAYRFTYLSVFTDPTAESQSAYARLTDVQVEGAERNILQKADSWLLHNKYTFWLGKVSENYFKTFSTQFLFTKGDPNLRHSIEGVGQFYKVEAIALFLGIVAFFVGYKDKKLKTLLAFWVLFGAVPSAITRDGGEHATRLIIILPPLVILLSYGLLKSQEILSKNWSKLFIFAYLLLLSFNFWSYQHNYWVHNPWYSERSWHAGYKEVVESLREYRNNFDKIILTNANDDPKIFFAVYYPADPADWQKGLLKENIPGFGELEHFGKFYFGQVDGEIGLDAVSGYMGESTLYIASSREVAGNLTMEPKKIPAGLKLIKTSRYPSGEPAFYFFSKNTN